MRYKMNNSQFIGIDANEKIWRFIDFTEYVDLLDKSSLFFTRSDRFDDPFEGCYPKTTLRLEQDRLKSNGRSMMEIEDNISKRKHKMQLSRLNTFLNSWHINEYESAAMWNLYSSTARGIAIQSTVGKLKDSLNKNKDYDIIFGRVKYIDYNNENLQFDDDLMRFLYKRKAFEFEQELRAITQYNNVKMQNENNRQLSELEFLPQYDGIYIPVQLDTLIENIITSPSAPEWFVNLVKSVTGKYNITKKVLTSELSEEPIM
jgi:hypothetical protein